MAVNALGFLDSICIPVFMSLCDIVGICDRLADLDSLSTQRYFQGKQLSRVVTLVLDHAIAAKRPVNFLHLATFPSPTFGPLFAFHCPLFFYEKQ